MKKLTLSLTVVVLMLGSYGALKAVDAVIRSAAGGTAHQVAIFPSTGSEISGVGPGSAGQGLVSNGASDPTYQGDGTTWTACPTLQNSWSNFGSSYQVCQYQKDSSGRVWLRGLIKGGTVTANTLLFTLPSGYRPASLTFASGTGQYAGSTIQCAGAACQGVVQLDIGTDGTVTLKNALNAASYLTLDYATFSVN